MTTMALQFQLSGTKMTADTFGDAPREHAFMRRTEMCEPAAIEAAGEGIVVRPEFMPVGKPYLFALLDKNVVAVKRADDSIDFYHVP
jgi:hypothetical protein